MRKVLSGMLGLLFWLGTQWIALGIAAGGHGWLAPLWLSMFLLLLYPVAFMRAFGETTDQIRLDKGLLATAAVLDVVVLGSLFAERETIVRAWSIDENPFVLALWAGLWTGWQVLLLAPLIGKRRQRIAAERS
jgi:hypothetical protein